MSFLVIIFIIIVIIRVLPTLLRWLIQYLLQRQARRMFNSAFGPQSQQQEPKKRRNGWSDAPLRRKKIDPNVGEYVKFQEVEVTQDTTTVNTDADTTHTTIHTTVEQQITDATWEEI